MPPDAGAIVYVRYAHAINSTDLVNRLRQEKSVLIVPGDHFGMDGYLRIGFGEEVGYLREGLNRLHELLASLDARVIRRYLRPPGRDSSTSSLIGFGNVGQRFVSLLDEQRTTLARQYGISPRIVGIATRRHGQAFSARGVDDRPQASGSC